MKKILFFILFFIELTNGGFSQNYSPFKNGYLYQYSYLGYNREYAIHSMKVDSARIEAGDSVFYFNKVNSIVFSSYDNSNLWGNKMIKRVNGDCFFIFQMDTVLLRTSVPIGSQWSFISQNIPYTVTFTSHLLGSIFNTSDSIKTLIVENNYGFKDSVKISKKYGVIYSFPLLFLKTASNNGHIDKSMNTVKLEYIYNLNLGKNRLNFLESFNFNVGDVFLHGYSSTFSVNPFINKVNAMTIVNKQISPNADTIKYRVTYCQSENFSQKTKTFAHVKTVNITVTSMLYANGIETFQHPLGKMHGNTTSYASYTMYAVDTTYGTFSIKGLYDYMGEIYESVIYRRNIGLTDSIHCFIPECNGSYVFIGKYKMLNAKDTCDFSELFPVSPDSLVKESVSPEMVLYPNPIKGEMLNLQCSNFVPGNYYYSIKNAMGVEIKANTFTIDEGESIALFIIPEIFLSTGVYSFSLKGSNYHSIERIVKY
jgi:hypothetical protein